MSAFLIVSDQAYSNYSKKKVKRNKSKIKSSSQSIMSVPSSSGSGSARRSSTTSFATTSRDKKKVFDVSTNTYMTYTPSEFEKAVSKYDEDLSLLKSSPYNNFNEVLNRKQLFDLKSLEMLRYTYFEDLNYNSVASFRLNQKNDKGDYNLKYMNKIARLTQSPELGLPRLSLCESPEREDEPEIKESDNSQRNVQAIFQNGQFWNNIYQELKFKSLQSKLNYIECLPSMSHLKNFYNEIMEYFLYNIHILKPDTEGITDPEEMIQLRSSYFVYFTEFNYQYFSIMKMEHEKLFRCCPNDNIRFTVFEKLIDTISENIMAMSGDRQNPALPGWEQFLEFIVYDLLSQDYEEQDKSPGQSITSTSTSISSLAGTTSYPYTPPRKVLISSRNSQQSYLSMGKTARTSSICYSERSPLSSPIYEETATLHGNEDLIENSTPENVELPSKTKKPSFFKRMLGGKKS